MSVETLFTLLRRTDVLYRLISIFRLFRLERECKIQMLALSAAPNGIKPIPVNHEEAVYTYNYTGREEAALIFAQVSVFCIAACAPCIPFLTLYLSGVVALLSLISKCSTSSAAMRINNRKTNSSFFFLPSPASTFDLQLDPARCTTLSTKRSLLLDDPRLLLSLNCRITPVVTFFLGPRTVQYLPMLMKQIVSCFGSARACNSNK